jgi:hypothetical protein
MPNTLLTITQITREALRVLHNNLVFARGVNRQYSSEFGVSGAKIGTTVNVRKPNRYFVRTTAPIQVQNTAETYVPLTLNRQWGVDTSFTSVDLTCSLDDFSRRILTPAMNRIASQIDYEGMGRFVDVYNEVGQCGQTPGNTTVATTGLQMCSAPIIYLNAGMLLDYFATPRDENRRIVLAPNAMAQSVSGLSGLFQDVALLSEQYRKGVLGVALGFEFALDQNVNSYTTGTRTTGSVGTIQATTVTGSPTLTTQTVTGTLTVGDIIQVSNVFSVNPENQQSTGILQQFVVTSAMTLIGTADGIPVSPTPVLAGTGIANGTVNRLPTAGDVVTILGAASTAFPKSMAYHQDAFTLATADLELPNGVDFAGRETFDGIAMRIIRAYDITADQFPCRIDVLGGWATLRPEMACRITG